jgi:hypothetical protein
MSVSFSANGHAAEDCGGPDGQSCIFLRPISVIEMKSLGSPITGCALGSLM